MTVTTALDPTDGRPVWAPRRGTALAPGYLAWHRLGVGHRCETWMTWSNEEWTPAVVKLARPDQLDHPRARDMLRREADVLARHSHPHLPRLLAGHTTRERPHLAMEWVDGTALDDLVDERGPLTGAEVLSLAAQLTATLRWLHRRGVAHLDVKPANVVVRDGWPVLVDLGSTRALGHRPAGPGEIGSPGYTAPELDAGGTVTAAMDLYGLGGVLLEALTAVPPGPGGPAPDAALPDHPVAPVVRALLAPDPDRRPRSADHVLSMLRAVAPEPVWPRFADRSIRSRPRPTSEEN